MSIDEEHLLFTARVQQRARECVNRDPELRDAMASPDDVAVLRDGNRTSIEYLAAACRRYATRPCLGMREFELAGGVATYRPTFSTLTYTQVWERVAAFAGGCAARDLLARDELVGICGAPSVNLVVADMACQLRGSVAVPLQPSLADDDLRHMVDQTRLATIACSAAYLHVIGRIVAGCPTVRTIVVMRGDAADAIAADAALVALRLTHRVIEMGELERAGATRPVPASPRPDPDRPITIIYSSGSTGRPKGVVLTQQRMADHLRAALDRPRIPLVLVGYLPQTHVAGRYNLYEPMMHGGVTYFTGAPDMSTLFEDMRLVRPTMVILLPKLGAAIYQQFSSELATLGLAAGDRLAAMEDDRVKPIMAKLGTTFLGSRVCVIRTGTAPLAPEVRVFLSSCFGVAVTNEYGSTETGPIAVNGRTYPWITYKLVDVPELGYSTSDRPFPRGELHVKSLFLTPGYFESPEATAGLFDDEGYATFGDIVEEREPGHLVVIDRRNAVLRLAHGEFVSISRLESVFSWGSRLISQIHLHGDPRHAYLLAVIVPNLDALGGTADPERVRRELRVELDRVARDERLRAHDVPRDFVIELEPFSIENQLLTGPGKPNRPRLQAVYRDRLDAMYAAIETRQLATLGGRDEATGIETQVLAILAIVLGLARDEIELGRARLGFTGFGGDSLNASRFSALLHEQLGVSLPVSAILDPVSTISDLVDLVHRGSSAAAYARIHDRDATMVYAAELELDRFLAPGEVATELVTGPPRSILLTGANGFLGRLILLELLARLPHAGTVRCLVRGATVDAARERLFAGFARSGHELVARVRALEADGRFVVHAGDLARPRFGLAESVHDELSGSVDAIVHNGALVNHALPYPHLFEPNVLGTAEVMRFATRRRRIAIHFVSTLGVASLPHPAPTVFERQTAAELFPGRSIGSGPSEHAVGYVTSKWAGEILLRQLHEHHGVPIHIFRCGMILPPRTYPGQVNEGDNISRLLLSVRATGLAPESFYAAAPDHTTPRYDGIAGDVVAASIASVAVAGKPGFQTYHLSNTDTKPIVSLDDMIRWMGTAGCRLTFLPHAEWFPRFEERLRALDKAERSRSALPVLSRWQEPIEPDDHRFDTACFRRTLHELLDLAQIPAVDEALVHHWLRSMA